jgi:hypothetical protein
VPVLDAFWRLCTGQQIERSNVQRRASLVAVNHGAGQVARPWQDRLEKLGGNCIFGGRFRCEDEKIIGACRHAPLYGKQLAKGQCNRAPVRLVRTRARKRPARCARDAGLRHLARNSGSCDTAAIGVDKARFTIGPPLAIGDDARGDQRVIKLHCVGVKLMQHKQCDVFRKIVAQDAAIVDREKLRGNQPGCDRVLGKHGVRQQHEIDIQPRQPADLQPQLCADCTLQRHLLYLVEMMVADIGRIGA